MRLAIFDIDGTLTETNEVDSVCFVQALADAHAITGVSTDWAGYLHTTDSWITREVFRERVGRPPDEGELTKFKQCFVGLLDDYRSKDVSLFGEVGGAAAAFGRLRREPGWAVAVASGCWRASGVLKLEAAGVEAGGVPAAFAEDGLSREEILLAAVSGARKFYGRESFDSVVSVGDGLWDVRAARNLKLPFLGVGTGARAEMLRRAGASHVIGEFTDYARLLRCLTEAGVPGAEGAA